MVRSEDISELLQRAKSDNVAIRHEAILKLGDIGSQDAIRQLMDIVNARVRKRYTRTLQRQAPRKPHWWSPTRYEEISVVEEVEERYNLDDQLAAVDALA